MPHKKRLGGGWTNPSEKYAQVKLDLISLNMQGENSKNIWVATTKTNGWNPLKNLDGLYFPFPAPFLRWTSREPFFGGKSVYSPQHPPPHPPSNTSGVSHDFLEGSGSRNPSPTLKETWLQWHDGSIWFQDLGCVRKDPRWRWREVKKKSFLSQWRQGEKKPMYIHIYIYSICIILYMWYTSENLYKVLLTCTYYEWSFGFSPLKLCDISTLYVYNIVNNYNSTSLTHVYINRHIYNIDPQMLNVWYIYPHLA